MIPKTIKAARRLMMVSLLFILFFLPQGKAEWQKQVQPPGPGDLTFVLPHPLEPSKLLAASTHQLFERGQRDGSWQTLWSEGGGASAVRRVLSFEFLPDHLFILTGQNLFMGDLRAKKWRKVYEGHARTGPALSFAVDPEDANHWLLGTAAGLMESDNAGKTWFRSGQFSQRAPVHILLFSAGRLFLGSGHTLYASASSENFRKSFEVPPVPKDLLFPGPDDPSGESLEEENESVLPAGLHDLIVSKKDPRHLWLGTEKGVFETKDQGLSWQPLSSSGFQDPSVRQLAYSERTERLYAATDRGVYVFSPAHGAWQELFKGLAQNKAASIALLTGPEESLAAVTPEGLLQYPVLPEEVRPVRVPVLSAGTLDLFRELLRAEPGVRDTQRAVIRYADVGNGKIKRWHAASRLSALLPRFSFGKDFSTANNIDLDRGGTSDPDRFIDGPSDTSRGWDADVSWDLGDFLYSSDQTAIDSREKMMVELRNSLLADATRIFYERRRLQTDLVFTPSVSEQEHLERLLRVDELTALLDGMTNGFFSKRLDRVYEERPAFHQLWGYTRTEGG